MWLPPVLTCTLKPGYINGFLEFINRVPFVPPEPYKADEAPGNNSTLSTSNSDKPMMLPTEKFKPGACVSIPSVIWFTRTLPFELKPRVLIERKVKDCELLSTPLRLAKAS